ncbi:MAG: M48 family metallopeptidase [Lachnospiraceae bacterium]|nr:M48 family metallopeptidase [Lachnospiraceae bacterium]
MIDLDNIYLKRSSRKTVSMEILPDGKVLVRAPLRMPAAEIKRFVFEHKGWLEKHLQKQKDAAEQASGPEDRLTMEELKELASKAAEVIPKRVSYYAEKIGVTYGRITIRNQKTRWGSCSSRGNLNFNVLLMLTPPEVIDSVIVHELCHRKQMNHSKRFYDEVLRVYPEYHKWNKWLKENESAIFKRMI